MDKPNLKDLTIEQLNGRMPEIRAPSYRAQQIFNWIYKRGVSGFKDMHNMPEGLRDKLDGIFHTGKIRLKRHVESVDGTEKFLFELSDGNFIESVLIRADKRGTICLSTQVGCKFMCPFCASGLNGFVRDLAPSEILDQILLVKNRVGRCSVNIVFMGMGEPLDNYGNLEKAVRIMNCRQGLNIGARRITVSTCGVIPGINRLRGLGLQVNLSISLHAAYDKLRDSLVPVNRKYPLEELLAACEDWTQATKRMITLEYLLLRDKNDSSEDAKGLCRIARRLNAKVNLIPYSPVALKRFNSVSKRAMAEFRDRLIRNNVKATVRESKGKDIQAACGQLACVGTSVERQNF